MSRRRAAVRTLRVLPLGAGDSRPPVPARPVSCPRCGSLFDRGARQFKFVDRTFNLNLRTSRAILDFFFERYEPGLFLHFEMIPDRFPESLRDSIRAFPPGALQFEVGVQTFNEQTAELISRRQDNQKLEENLRFLREQTGVHVHADLIVGLPGESLESFAAGFDRLVRAGPAGDSSRHAQAAAGDAHHPARRANGRWSTARDRRYEILSNRLLDADTIARLARFARFWDLVANSGNFVESAPLLWRDRSPFAGFLAFADWLYARLGRTWGIPLAELTEGVFRFLVDVLGQDAQADGRSNLAGLPTRRTARSPGVLEPVCRGPLPAHAGRPAVACPPPSTAPTLVTFRSDERIKFPAVRPDRNSRPSTQGSARRANISAGPAGVHRRNPLFSRFRRAIRLGQAIPPRSVSPRRAEHVYRPEQHRSRNTVAPNFSRSRASRPASLAGRGARPRLTGWRCWCSRAWTS